MRAYRYCEVEPNMIKALYGSGKDNAAIKARIKNYLRADFGVLPIGCHCGKGKHIFYTETEIQRLYVALHLNMIVGLSRIKVLEVFKENNISEFLESRHQLLLSDCVTIDFLRLAKKAETVMSAK